MKFVYQGSTNSTLLQFARVPIISDADCKKFYTGKKIPLEKEKMACTSSFIQIYSFFYT